MLKANLQGVLVGLRDRNSYFLFVGKDRAVALSLPTNYVLAFYRFYVVIVHSFL
jgi:hypothetical protein